MYNDRCLCGCGCVGVGGGGGGGGGEGKAVLQTSLLLMKSLNKTEIPIF